MKKIALLALAASTAAIATPASAQAVASGTITLTGSVAPKCTVTAGASNFTSTVPFGELADANGILRTGLETDFGTKSAKVVCTSGSPTIKVEAQPLAATTTAPSGYANRIDFTAAVAVTTTGTSPAPFTDSSTTVAALGPVAIGGGMLANTANNINITTTGYATPNVTDILVADNAYQGKVIVTIAPN